MTENIKIIIDYRLSRSYETIEEAKLLATANHWNTTANRFYYACFYAVIALLLKNNVNTKSHSGARIVLSKLFVKTGKLSENAGWIYGDLFNKRQESDYKDVKIFTKEEIEPLIPQAEEFIEMIKKLLNEL
jgi:uncharacterized protein (UPF0332 family)